MRVSDVGDSWGKGKERMKNFCLSYFSNEKDSVFMLG